jgi:hypothetical protein
MTKSHLRVVSPRAVIGTVPPRRVPPFTRAGSAKMVARLGQEAGFKFGVHPHISSAICSPLPTMRSRKWRMARRRSPP